jgi:hypothetical protein
MFQTIIKLYDNRVQNRVQANKIYFGGSIIVCDEKNVCSVHEECNNININTTCVKTESIPTIVLSI